MHARFPYGPLEHYPHLAAKEVVIWDRFVRANPQFAEMADYDVTCGQKDKVPLGTPEHTKEDWDYLRSWKIDAVAIKDGVHYVIEVRPRAGLGAIGEILSKAIMFQEEHAEIAEVEPVLITDEERPNMRALCAEHDIGFVVV
mgnify:FL=1